ncbi:hypothetical protein [Bacteroides sp.]|uniref:hypothetical protein n=1 Tax=Bacteroides sp. TaxID=29523 RepID=UPI00257D570F|nr:hypothetical protein [Bacteroides sp.]
MKTKKIMELVMLCISFAFFAISCQQDDNLSEITDNKATVSVRMKGIGTYMDNVQMRGISTPKVQYCRTTFQGEEVVATLTEVGGMMSRAEGAITPLPDGTEYSVMVYADGELKASHTFVQGSNDEFNFELTPGTYIFKAYAYGNKEASGADKDPLWCEKEVAVTSGTNSLDILLVHKLTEVKVVFNAGASHTIQAINKDGAQSVITPNFNYTFNEESGEVTFNEEIAPANIMFPTQEAGNVWTSDPVMIAVENTENGKVELKGVVIDGVSGEVALDGWVLKAGVQYELTINLGDKLPAELTYTVTVPAGTKNCYMKGGFLSMNNNWADFIQLEKTGENTFSVTLPTYKNETYRYFAEKGKEYIEVNADDTDKADRTWNENQGVDVVDKWKTMPSEPTLVTIKCLVPRTVTDLYIIGTFDIQWQLDPLGEKDKMTYVGEEGDKKAFIYEYTTINPTGLEFKFAAGPGRQYIQSASENYTTKNVEPYEANKYAYEALAFKSIWTPSVPTTAKVQWQESTSQLEEAVNKYW